MRNYLFACVESEARLGLLAQGCDPTMGVPHADQRNRNSLVRNETHEARTGRVVAARNTSQSIAAAAVCNAHVARAGRRSAADLADRVRDVWRAREQTQAPALRCVPAESAARLQERDRAETRLVFAQRDGGRDGLIARSLLAYSRDCEDTASAALGSFAEARGLVALAPLG